MSTARELVAGALAEHVALLTGGLVMGTVALLAGAARRPPPIRRVDGPHMADIGARPATRRRPPIVMVMAIVVALVAALVVGVLLTLVVAVLGGCVLVRRRHRRALSDRRAMERALPDAVELLVLCIHAGRSPTQAISELARRAPLPLRPAFAAVELQLHRGRRLGDALITLPDHTGPCTRELTSAIALADREGLPIVPVLDRLAVDARQDRRRHGEAEARRLPVRLSFPLVACTLPAFVLLAIAPAVLGALSTLRGPVP